MLVETVVTNTIPLPAGCDAAQEPIQHYCAPDSGTARGSARVDQTGRMRSDPRRPLATLLTAGVIG